MDDRLRVAPAAERNKAPLLKALRDHLPQSGKLLEIASGFGQHVLYLSQHLPNWRFQPTDIAKDHVETIQAWLEDQPRQNVEPPMVLDVSKTPWCTDRDYNAVLCINMVHISPWASTEGLFRGARDAVGERGQLITYGPYRVQKAHTAESNAEFDRRLREMDPRFGVRDLERLNELADINGFGPAQRIEMPANNFVLIFESLRAH